MGNKRNRKRALSRKKGWIKRRRMMRQYLLDNMQVVHNIYNTPIIIRESTQSESTVTDSETGTVMHCLNQDRKEEEKSECNEVKTDIEIKMEEEEDHILGSIPEGRCIVDIPFIWNEIHKTFDDHALETGCQFKYWKLDGQICERY